MANSTGLGQGAHDAHQTLRGLRTLFSRTRQQDDTAMILARHLRADVRIVADHHSSLKPGLIRFSISLEHPQDLTNDVQQALDHTPLV